MKAPATRSPGGIDAALRVASSPEAGEVARPEPAWLDVEVALDDRASNDERDSCPAFDSAHRQVARGEAAADDHDVFASKREPNLQGDYLNVVLLLILYCFV